MSASAKENIRCPRAEKSSEMSTAEATTAMPAKNQRCQPLWPARKLKAAPGL